MDILKMIDHTVLKATATKQDIEKLCAEAKEFGFASVCVNPVHVPLAANLLSTQNKDGYYPAVCTVVGFPLGASNSEIKGAETIAAVLDGAHEIDMVIDVGAAKEGRWDDVQADIENVVISARDAHAMDERKNDINAVNPIDRPVIVKVIFENCYLTKDEIAKACECAKKAGADFVKTSTGFGTPGNDKDGKPIAIGATPEDVALMRKTVGAEMGVKAAGGIRDLASAKEMVEAGATRLGCSAGLIIAKELLGQNVEKTTSGSY